MALWIWQWAKSFGENFGVIDKGSLFRSARPDTARLLEYRRELGLRVVLSLREGEKKIAEDRWNALSAELVFHSVPMKDDAAPDAAQVRRALSVLSGSYVDWPTLVFCQGNRHRTGLVTAVYRVVVQRYSKQDAWKECEKMGFYRHGGHGPLEDWFWDSDLQKLFGGHQ